MEPHDKATQRMISLAVIEYFAAAGIALWGLWVLYWGTGGAISSAAFDDLRASVEGWGIGPAWRVMGLGGILLGFIYASGVAVNGRGMYWTPLARGGSCLTAVVFLAHLSVSIYNGQESSTGVFTYAFIGVVYVAIFLSNLDRIAQSALMIGRKLRGICT